VACNAHDPAATAAIAEKSADGGTKVRAKLLASLGVPGQRQIGPKNFLEVCFIFDGHRHVERPRRGEAHEHRDIHARQNVAGRRRLDFKTETRQSAKTVYSHWTAP
jgi:hypothetical protein